ncbi:MAG: YbgA family protein [Acidobacteriota bacterium]
MEAPKSQTLVEAGSGVQRPIRIGISSCLLGEAVRFDGGHKRDPFLTELFGKFVEWVPVCPEVECGFGTPRESMRLVRVNENVRLLTVRSGVDLTDRLTTYTLRRVEELDAEHLSGYVLKKDSPSCGMARVKIYNPHGMAEKAGRGVFAAGLLDRFPALPVEEEGRLSDPRLRENFVERVFAYWRLQGLFSGRWSVGALVAFHTAHKLILMAHSPQAYQQLGRLVAGARGVPRKDLERRYTEMFMSALAVIATPRRHVNVLQHMAGYLKDKLDGESKRELSAAIDDYGHGLVPLIVPITLLRHYVRMYAISYLTGQLYLAPHPKELMLRNHV